MNTTERTNTINQITKIQTACLNVVKKSYGTNSTLQYYDGLMKNSQKITHINGHAGKFTWIFTNFHEVTNIEINKENILLTVRRKNYTYDETITISKNILHQSLTTTLKELRKEIAKDKKRHIEIYMQCIGNDELARLERKINLLKTYQKAGYGK